MIRKTTASQGGDYTTRYLLDYLYFKEYLNMIAKNLSKQQALHVDSKAMQKISFTGSLRSTRQSFNYWRTKRN